MLPPRRLILSRKSFDSACGGVPSPIFPDGSFRSLPIPRAGSPVCYAQIGGAGPALGGLVDQLTRGRIGGAAPAHLDPDLDPGALGRGAGWRPGFGQVGAAQSHLDRLGVGPGDLFLFFGWFRAVESHAVAGWRYRTGAPDLHILFGWLQVEHVDLVGGDPAAVLRRRPWLDRHPHLCGEWPALNTIYSAARRLTLSGIERDLPGGGRFARISERLVLTDPAGPGRTHWRLPGAFWPGERTPLTYHADPRRWRRADDHVLLRSLAQGQEFVLDLDAYPAARPWLASLFEAEDQREVPGGGSLISGMGSSAGGMGIGEGGSSIGGGISGSVSGG